jgi:hypothetical protein
MLRDNQIIKYIVIITFEYYTFINIIYDSILELLNRVVKQFQLYFTINIDTYAYIILA